VISRWDIVEAHHRATSLAAARFLEVLTERMPFPIAAFQVDGGSESPQSSSKPASRNKFSCSCCRHGPQN
jgi:hypothetical protein